MRAAHEPQVMPVMGRSVVSLAVKT
jgi:hypothetical protein